MLIPRNNPVKRLAKEILPDTFLTDQINAPPQREVCDIAEFTLAGLGIVPELFQGRGNKHRGCVDAKAVSQKGNFIENVI